MRVLYLHGFGNNAELAQMQCKARSLPPKTAACMHRAAGIRRVLVALGACHPAATAAAPTSQDVMEALDADASGSISKEEFEALETPPLTPPPLRS